MSEPREASGSLDSVSWPRERMGEALELLAARSGIAPAPGAEAGAPPRAATEEAPGDAAFERWLEGSSARLGLAAEPVQAPYPELDDLVRGSAPALLRLDGPGGARFLALVAAKGERPLALAPDLSTRPVDPEAVRAALGRPVEGPRVEEIEPLLERAGLRGTARDRARRALLDELLAAQRVGGCWLLRPAPGASLRRQAREMGIGRLGAGLVAAHAAYYMLWLLSWWLLGRGALEGRLDRGWLLGWALVLLTLVPFRLLAGYASGVLAVRTGALIKRRLLTGSFRLEGEDVRQLGSGQLLGRAIESEALEQVAFTGAMVLTAVIELVFCAAVLAAGAGGGLHVLCFLAWTAATVWLAHRYFLHRRRWTEARFELTDDLVEGMVGHRTRLAQESPERWHEGEDTALDRYHTLSQRLDRAAVSLQALVPRGWFIVGVLGLAPAFVAGGATGRLAIGVGGILLALQAFQALGAGLARLVAAGIAWENVRLFWEAASRPLELGRPEAVPAADAADGPRQGEEEGGDGVPLLDVRDLVFRHAGREEPVLDGAGLRVRTGERLLLEGPSGGGKSTLGTLLTGCRVPAAGLILLGGLDRKTLGEEAWRRRVVFVPQFHENRVLQGPFAFNLLLGRRWPPRPEDLEEAETLCRDLGLGPLIERMPAGLFQPVGETGWQLSHGERGRLFIARALLQRPDAMVLDESFAALDPWTLRTTLRCVLERASTVLVIAHP